MCVAQAELERMIKVMYYAKTNKTPLELSLQFFGDDTGLEGANKSYDQTSENKKNTGESDIMSEKVGSNIEELIKRAVDRATNKLGNDNKKLKEQLDKVSREKLSSDELKQLEAAEREATLAEREAQIADKENRFYAIKAIKAAGLDTGDETALELVDFVIGNTYEDIDSRVATFSKLLSKLVKSSVDSTFKEHGRIPDKSSTEKNEAQSNIGAVLGKLAADNNRASEDTLKHYLGGK